MILQSSKSLSSGPQNPGLKDAIIAMGKDAKQWTKDETRDAAVIFWIHVWYVYLSLPQKSTSHVGKYTSPMDPMGYCWRFDRNLAFTHQLRDVGSWNLPLFTVGF